MAERLSKHRKREKYIFEIRYKANPKIADDRGDITAIIWKKFEKILPEWQLENAGIIFSDKLENSKVRAEIGIHRTAFVMEDPSSRDFFIDNAISFFAEVYDYLGSDWKTTIKRIGFRSIFVYVHPRVKSYTDIINFIKDKFLKTIPVMSKNPQLKDLKITIVHEFGRWEVGPFKKGELWAKTMYNDPDKGTPDAGIAIDIDTADIEVKINQKSDLNECFKKISLISTGIEEQIIKFLEIMNG